MRREHGARRPLAMVRAVVGVGALMGALLLGVVPAASAAPGAGAAPAVAPEAIVFVQLVKCNDAGPGDLCEDGQGNCYEFPPAGVGGGPKPTTCPDDVPNTDPGCYDAAGKQVPCDDGQCAEGQCTKDCVDAAGARVPCDSDDCTAGKDCEKQCRDVTGAPVDCDSGDCTQGDCSRDCLNQKGDRVPCDSNKCTAGADCEQQCYNANGKVVDCTSQKCVEGKDCNPPTKTKTTKPPTTTESTDLLGSSGSAKAPSALAETGVPTGSMLFLAFGFLAAGGGLALVARRRGNREHR